MKTINSMVIFLFFTLFSISTTSCDNGEYYKTFDYRTMTFIESISKSDFCVRKISQTDNKIEMEVFFNGNKIKRTFIKKEDYWYSKYKYITINEPGFAVDYGDIFEFEYLIYKDFIITKQDVFIVYKDLIKKNMSFYECYEDVDIKKIDLSKMQNKLVLIHDYYTMNGNLFRRDKNYQNGKFTGEVIENEPRAYADLDFFYMMDFENYRPSTGRKSIYD